MTSGTQIKILLTMLCALLGPSAAALEVAGVSVADRVQVAGQAWVLNGAGSRRMAGMFNVYVIALYLPEKKNAVAEILDETLAKRIALNFLFGVSSAQLLEVTHKVMSENHTAEELKKTAQGWQEFSALFEHIKDINKGDQLTLDYVPAANVRVMLGNKEIGRIADKEFMRAFLKIWMGNRPAQADLKERLLGREP